MQNAILQLAHYIYTHAYMDKVYQPYLVEIKTAVGTCNSLSLETFGVSERKL
jgi:hypothetical protein